MTLGYDSVENHLIVILDSHAQSVNENRQKNTLLEVFVLHELLDPPSYAAQRADAAVAGGAQESSRARRLLPLLGVLRPLIAVLLLTATGTIVDVRCQPLRTIL